MPTPITEHRKNSLRFPRLVLIVVNLLSVALYLQSATSWNHDGRKDIDFISFYTAARLPVDQIYNLERQKEIQIEVIGRPQNVPSGVLPFNSSPIYLPILKLLASDDYIASYWRWVAFLTLVCLACGVVLFVITEDWLAAVTGILFYPLFNAVAKGQISPLLTLGVLLWGYFLKKGNDKGAGISLGLLLGKPHLAIAFAVPTFFANRSAFGWFVLVSSVVSLICFGFLGVKGVEHLLHTTHLMFSTDMYGLHRQDQQNLLGLLIRMGVETNTAIRISWACFLMMIVASCWILNRDLTRSGLATALIVLTSPHLHLHDLSLLLLPMAAVSTHLKHKPLAFAPGSPVILVSRTTLPYVLIAALCYQLTQQALKADRD